MLSKLSRAIEKNTLAAENYSPYVGAPYLFKPRSLPLKPLLN
jgi:hypothetical protein